MKKIFIIFFVFPMLFSACEKALDTVPSDFISPEYYYNTETDLNNALAGVYDRLGVSYGNLYDSFDSSDQMFLASATTFGKPDIFLYSSNDGTVYNIWQGLYAGIERANLLLANIDKAKMDIESNRDIIKGQAKFLRAYYYFVLVQNWGDVPLKTMPTNSVTDVNFARTPANEVYDFIIKEMEEAESMVQDITVYNHAGRITKSAVQGVLARVCLYKAGFPNDDKTKYTDALKWATKAIDSGLHSLNQDYSQVFINLIQDKYDIKESIWEVEFRSTGLTDTYGESGSIGIGVGIFQGIQEYGYVVGSYGIHQYFYNKFDERDLRRNWNIAPYQFVNNSNPPQKSYFKDTESIYLRKPGKYRREYDLTVGKQKNICGTNFPLLRYSDVLLMAAEADNEIAGPTAKSIEYVNQVRRRGYGNGRLLKTITVSNGGTGFTSAPTITISGGGGINSAGIEQTSAVATVTGGKVTAIKITHYGTFYTSAPSITISGGGGTGATAVATLSAINDADLSPDQTADKDAFRLAIQDERSRELAFEAQRRLDLVRWGIFIPKMREVAAYCDLTAPSARSYAGNAGKWVSEKNYYLPIPLREMNLNKVLVQNPGW